MGKLAEAANSRSAVAGKSLLPIADHGLNNSVQAHAPNPKILDVGHVQVASRIDGDTKGDQSAAGRGYSLGGGQPAASHCRDDPRGSDLSHAKIGSVGDIQIALRIYADSDRRIQLGARGRPSIAGKPWLSRSRYGGDDSIWRDAADAVRVGIADV